MTRYFDSHCHLADDQLWPEADQVIQRAQANHVTRILTISTNQQTLTRNLQLTAPGIFQAAAIHPSEVSTEPSLTFDLIAQAAASGRLSAIGESGLDYHYPAPETRPLQQEYLAKFCDLALHHNLPIIIHSRDCYDDLAALLQPYSDTCSDIPGVIHCFTGTYPQARHWLDNGWMISLSGIITFKNSTDLREVARAIPIDRLLIETDAPYLAPTPHRGRRNEPSYLPETAAALATLHSMTPDKLGEITYQNMYRMLRLTPD
jgi:TatD DNase family protein